MTTLRDQRATLARGRRLARISLWVLGATFAFSVLGGVEAKADGIRVAIDGPVEPVERYSAYWAARAVIRLSREQSVDITTNRQDVATWIARRHLDSPRRHHEPTAGGDADR